jgi:hypothetical protein
MAKDKKKDRGHAKADHAKSDHAKSDKDSGRRAVAADAVASHGTKAADAAGGQHHAAKAHGRATQVDMSLPGTRPELMALHADARARRNGAALDSSDFRAAVMDLERIEIRIAAIDRAADPPLG